MSAWRIGRELYLDGHLVCTCCDEGEAEMTLVALELKGLAFMER